MSNKSSVGGKYLSRIFKAQGDIQDDRAARYDEMILRKQRKESKRKRKQERQNRRKARK